MKETIPFKPPKSFTIEELQNRLERLKAICPLTIEGEDKKRHSAVGETLEVYLGLRNDSSPTSDWGDYEIKTSGISKSMVSMFSIKWNLSPGYNLRKLAFDYGKEHFSKHLQMPCIRLDSAIPHLSEPQPKLHFKVHKSKNLIVLKYDDNDIGVIEIMNLRSKFIDKFKNLVVIDVERMLLQGQNVFTIRAASVFENASFSAFLGGLIENAIKVEFQIFILSPGTSQEVIKKQSSKIRISHKKIETIYAVKRKLI